MPQIPTPPRRAATPGHATGSEHAIGETVLEINALHTDFVLDEGTVRAVAGVDLRLERGRTLGLVGESGCGKSVTARSVLQIAGANAVISSGEILLHKPDGVLDLTRFAPGSEQIRGIRGNDIAMIFQEPMTAFAPIYTVGHQIAEALRCHRGHSKQAAWNEVLELLARVRIPDPRRAANSYPFELSGGMLQRAMIAMALSCEPSVLIADEPTTALDVTVQAQILELLCSIQQETGMAIMMISHNMGVIAEMADVVAVMYVGRVVEQAAVWDLFERPRHPYTRALLAAVPMVTEQRRELLPIAGNVPNPLDAPGGCSFHPRCEYAIADTCDKWEPGETEVGSGHRARCFLLEGPQEGREHD